MVHKLEAVAILVMLAGFLLFRSLETLPVGALLVAAGAYAMVLPRFIDPWEPNHRPRRP